MALVSRLFSRGISPHCLLFHDAAVGTGATSLHVAATGDCGDDEKACEIVALLSSRHANQAARNRSGERPVDTAHQRGNVALIKALNGAWEDFERLSLTT